jgi:hypothetical protein
VKKQSRLIPPHTGSWESFAQGHTWPVTHGYTHSPGSATREGHTLPQEWPHTGAHTSILHIPKGKWGPMEAALGPSESWTAEPASQNSPLSAQEPEPV